MVKKRSKFCIHFSLNKNDFIGTKNKIKRNVSSTVNVVHCTMYMLHDWYRVCMDLFCLYSTTFYVKRHKLKFTQDQKTFCSENCAKQLQINTVKKQREIQHSVMNKIQYGFVDLKKLWICMDDWVLWITCCTLCACIFSEGNSWSVVESLVV
jgi:hypothetical protein